MTVLVAASTEDKRWPCLPGSLSLPTPARTVSVVRVRRVSTRDTVALTAALVFVRELDRSLAFYQEVFELRVHVRQPELALLRVRG